MSHEWSEEKWSPRNLVVSRVERVIPLHERRVRIFGSLRCRRWNIIWWVLEREILKPCRDNHSLIKVMVSWRRLLALSWLLAWKWILKSSANRMVLRGKDIMEVTLLAAPSYSVFSGKRKRGCKLRCVFFFVNLSDLTWLPSMKIITFHFPTHHTIPFSWWIWPYHLRIFLCQKINFIGSVKW